MADIDEAARLDRLIEARRAGEGDLDGGVEEPARELTDLADLAAGLDELGRAAPALGEDIVWARVSAGLDAAPRSGRASWWRGPSLPGWMNRPVWAAAGAATAVVFVVALALIAPSRSTSAAFFEDVAQLSDVADAALADNLLTEGEKDNFAALATALLEAIDRHTGALDELEPEQHVAVLTTLSGVMSRLTPLADGELTQAAGAGGNVESPPLQATGDGDAGAAAVQAEQAAVPVRPAPDGGAAQGISVVAPSVAALMASLQEVTEAVEEAHSGRGRVRPSTATPGRLAGVCKELKGESRSECNRGVNSAFSACSKSSNATGGDCSEAVAAAAGVCRDLLSSGLLSPEAATTCAQGLSALELQSLAQGDDGDG